MNRMVLGFAFNIARDQVLLIKKARPDWQKGHFNGVGGKIEEGEFPLQAMRREFKEETGVDIKEDRWAMFASMKGRDTDTQGSWEVLCYRTHLTSHEAVIAQNLDEEEPVCLYCCRYLPLMCLYNLRWLITLALDTEVMHAEVQYRSKR